MKFSILIPTWNNLALLRLCVESALKNPTFTHEIIKIVLFTMVCPKARQKLKRAWVDNDFYLNGE